MWFHNTINISKNLKVTKLLRCNLFIHSFIPFKKFAELLQISSLFYLLETKLNTCSDRADNLEEVGFFFLLISTNTYTIYKKKPKGFVSS